MKTDTEKLHSLILAVRGYIRSLDAFQGDIQPHQEAVQQSYLRQLRETVSLAADGCPELEPAPIPAPAPAPADPFIRFEDRNVRIGDYPMRVMIRESAVLSVARQYHQTLCVLKLAGWPHNVTVQMYDLPEHLRP